MLNLSFVKVSLSLGMTFNNSIEWDQNWFNNYRKIFNKFWKQTKLMKYNTDYTEIMFIRIYEQDILFFF